MPSPFKECQSDGIYTCSYCMTHGTVNCPPKPDQLDITADTDPALEPYRDEIAFIRANAEELGLEIQGFGKTDTA